MMIENASARVLIGALNLIAVSGPLIGNVDARAEVNDSTIEKLNAMSLKSIESSWLLVPPACKARAFNASAESLGSMTPSVRAESIYLSFGA